MAANLILKIAEMLGMELGEEFKIKDNTGTLDSVSLNSVYAFVEQDSFEGPVLAVSTGESRPLYMPPRPLEPIALKVFELLCRGKCEVVKLPWKPKKGETFYSFYAHKNTPWIIVEYEWDENPADFSSLKAGWLFRTREEAEEALPKIAAELGVRYEI